MSSHLKSSPPSDEIKALVSTSKPVDSIPVVAIGASSGGIKALESFFRNVPSDCGMAFVLAMHLSPEHESRLASILQSFTTMSVTQVNTPVRVMHDHVYVIAPGKLLSLENGRLQANPRLPSSTVIDHLFHSVAKERQELAVAIVLSGSGTDGMLGMLAIHERGGLLVAQDPAEAEYPAMPNSIIDTGVVDIILPAARMPLRLKKMQEQAPRVAVPEAMKEVDEDVLKEILDTLLAGTGYDFSHYKRSTLLRQINRRMMVVQAEDLVAYAQLVYEAEEAESLVRNLLISVTRFFRDPKAFLKLEKKVLPELFRNVSSQEDGDPGGVRVWVPGCATGEEVYSLAMLLAEQRDATERQIPIQILASDIDEAALTIARRRRYSESVTSGLSAERLERFFYKKEDAFEIRDSLRALIVFSAHDLTRDPPFTRIDLLSCRNLLMYFDTGMQQKILQRFAYSIRPGGYLFLGAAEGIDSAPRYFKPVSKSLGLFCRTQVASTAPPLDFFPLSRSVIFGLASRTTAVPDGSDDDSVTGSPDSVSNHPGGTEEPTQRELMLANQEMQSLNEELRSMMEELEVAKEELQSLNEELITVNQELQNKIEEHRRVNTDLQILIESTHMATLFLDRKLNVVLFTPESTKLYNLLPIDIGRPLDHISHRLTYSDVLVDARQVLESSTEVKREVQTRDGAWYAMRAMPYRSDDGPAEGVVLTFAEITSQKAVEKVSEDRFSLAFHAGPMAAAIVVREDGRFIDVNHIFEEISGFARDEIIGKLSSDFGFYFGDDTDSSSTGTPLEPPLNEVETRIRTRSGSQRDLVVSSTKIDFGGRPCYLSLFYDVTERKRLEREILLVSDREQRRIGVDLHDGLGAHLSGVSMMASGLARKLRNGRGIDPEEMDEIAQLLSDGIEQARSLAQGLNPFLLEVRGLTIALSKLASGMEEQTGIACSFEEEEHEIALSSEQSMHLYRIAQEAITNAIRHGKPDQIRITLTGNERRFRLSIHDNGIGYNPGSTVVSQPAGMGLSIMRYRAEMIGAQLKITGSPDRGTTVLCIFRAPK